MKDTPKRMCIGCREKKPKKELLRLSLEDDGVVTVDPRSREAGRGAYLCKDGPEPDPACLAQANKYNAFRRAFKKPVELTPELQPAGG